LRLPQEQRVQLLMQDYIHFVDQPELLNAQLECLLQLHGREKISRWQAMASSGQMPALVDQLLTDHYDPAYLRSIYRNFKQFAQAEMADLPDIAQASFEELARRLAAAA
jgi:tRNA 2-selenouridine synthase